MSLCVSPWRAESQFPTVLWFSWMLALLISVAVVLEAFLFSAGPMGRVPDGALFLREGLWVYDSPPFVGWCTGGGSLSFFCPVLWRSCSVSLQVHRSCSVSLQVLFRENESIYTVTLVCPWQEEGSGSSYASILRNVLIFNGQKWRKNTQNRQGPKETRSFFNWLEEKSTFGSDISYAFWDILSPPDVL